MTREQVTLVVWTCDGCGKRVQGSPDGERAWGYHGDVMHVGAHGGNGGEWYACGRRCIRNAVLAVTDEAGAP